MGGWFPPFLNLSTTFFHFFGNFFKFLYFDSILTFFEIHFEFLKFFFLKFLQIPLFGIFWNFLWNFFKIFLNLFSYFLFMNCLDFFIIFFFNFFQFFPKYFFKSFRIFFQIWNFFSNLKFFLKFSEDQNVPRTTTLPYVWPFRRRLVKRMYMQGRSRLVGRILTIINWIFYVFVEILCLLFLHPNVLLLNLTVGFSFGHFFGNPGTKDSTFAGKLNWKFLLSFEQFFYKILATWVLNVSKCASLRKFVYQNRKKFA